MNFTFEPLSQASAFPSLAVGHRKMDASIYQRLHPHTYLQRFLERGVRTDGRGVDDWRSVGINTGFYFCFVDDRIRGADHAFLLGKVRSRLPTGLRLSNGARQLLFVVSRPKLLNLSWIVHWMAG